MLSEWKLYCDGNVFYIIYVFKQTLGVHNRHPLEISYVSKKNVESNIQKLNRIEHKRKYPQNI